jgi:hypothetical protein
MNPPGKTITLLFNPFFYVAGGRALGLGLAAILLAALLGSWGNLHFDGVLDTHAGAAAPLWVFVAEGLIDWLCLAITVWVAGKIISRTAFRAIDVFGTQALARWPTLLISLIALPKAVQRFSNELLEQLKRGKFDFNSPDAIIFLAVTIGMIPFIVWTIFLMYKSFSVSCNVKGGKAVAVFIAALIVAEVFSKLCLAPIFQHALTPPASASQPASTSQAVPFELATPAADDVTGFGTRFVDLLAKDDVAGAYARFDETMKKAMPEATLRATWQALLKQVGTLQKQLGARVEEQAGYTIVFVTCQFERAALDIKVVFDAKRQVAGLFYVPSQAGSDALKPKGN